MTPFLLLAAACYLRGSPRMYRWMMTNRVFGSYLADYRAGRGVPARTKAMAITLLWIGITASAMLFVTKTWGRIALGTIGTAVTIHIVMIRTKRLPSE